MKKSVSNKAKIISTLEKLGGTGTLQQIYETLSSYNRTI